MGLAKNARFGPYEVIALLGAGGMGEVYRARDTRLKREVALKILPPEFAQEPARRQRFELEARTVAALNHPNIVSIYDVGAENDTFYIVTELIDGEPLRGAGFGLRKSLDCAVQIANGLAAAHAAGVIHRDLKPDNILLTRDGRIKILDFGLAKVNVSRTAPPASETLTVNTAAGVVMGTVGYMSPEQVRGKEADPRSDIFSFGVILYELLSGRRAFHGDTSVETMTAILKQEPPDLPETVPPGVRQLVHNCLDKNPENRFQSARDLSFALAAISQTGSQSGAAPAVAVPSRWRRWALGVAMALGAAVLALMAYRLLRPAPQPKYWTGAILGGPEIAFRPRPSPDGHLVAFYAVDRGYTQVAVMKPETGNWSMLTHSQQHGFVTNVSWAPDGASIYYDRFTALPQGIYNVPVLGGDEHLVFANAFRPEALPDGSLLAVRLNPSHEWQLFRFWPASGRVQDLPVAVVDAEDSLSNERIFPDGKHAVLDGAPLGQEAGGMRLLVVDLATGATRPLAPGVPRGVGAPDFAVTRDGKSVLVTMQLGSFTRVVSVPASGQTPVQQLFTTTSQVWGVDSAPDGSVYACVTDQPAELAIRSVDRDEPQAFARFPGVADESAMVVLPDGRAVMTVVYSDRARLVAVERGKDPVSLVATTEETSAPLAVAGPREIAFMIGPRPRDTIAIADIETGFIARRIAPGKGEILSLAASPDGGTLYFAAGSTVWSIASTGGEARKIRAGNRVVAAPDGRTLLVSVLESPDMRLFRVPLDGGPEVEIPADRSHSVEYSLLSAGAWNRDGRLLVSLQDNWFNTPAVLNTLTGRVLPLPFDNANSYLSMAWLPDGRIVALRIGTRSTLWRFQQAKD
jgi:predicted Ser/Thr protein kinase/DNA-binding beta-propeller fold protein YncE